MPTSCSSKGAQTLSDRLVLRIAHKYLYGAHLVDVERHAGANVEEARQLHPSADGPSGSLVRPDHEAALNLLSDSRLKIGPRVVHNVARSIEERPRARPKGHKLDLAAARAYERLSRANVAARADDHTEGQDTRNSEDASWQ